MSDEQTERALDKLTRLFDRPVCQKGTGPLRKGVEIAITVDEEGPFTLKKERSGAVILPSAPSKPDIVVTVPQKGLDRLLALSTEDVGDIGVEILKLVTSQDKDTRMTLKVKVGMLTMVRNGYLGVLPLGGTTVMKFLASKGFTGLGKIKQGIESLRS